MLAPEVIQKYKKRLEKEKREISAWLSFNNGEYPDGIEDYEVEQRGDIINKYLKTRSDKKEREKDIEDALARIANGTFGICINPDCGCNIPEERLDTDPVRKRCCPCQANHFAEELKQLSTKKNNNHRSLHASRESRRRQNKKPVSLIRRI